MRWKVIDGFDGLYRVSDTGAVQSQSAKYGPLADRGRWWDMTIGKDRHGYPLVYLWDKTAPKGKQRVRRLVHQLVAESFLPGKPEHANCVNHLNGIKQDNRAANLEWTTLEENMKHAWRTRLCRPPKLTDADVREILTCGGTDTATAKRFGVSQVMVTRIRARKAWRHVA
jgi:hypothetical protein